MGDLSLHFDSSEFACRCGCGAQNVDPSLVDALEQWRRGCGNRPITVLSGCRCPDHNATIGGAADSLHLTMPGRPCRAADVRAAGVKLATMFAAAVHVPLFQRGGIGVYTPERFLHLDVRPGRARWARHRDRYVALPPDYVEIETRASRPES